MFSLTNSRSAISRLLSPAAIASRISSSRGVMPSCSQPRLVALERPGDRHAHLHRHFPHDHGLARPRELEAEPDPERREEQRDDAAVDLERVLEDEKAVLDRA